MLLCLDFEFRTESFLLSEHIDFDLISISLSVSLSANIPLGVLLFGVL